MKLVCFTFESHFDVLQLSHNHHTIRSRTCGFVLPCVDRSSERFLLSDEAALLWKSHMDLHLVKHLFSFTWTLNDGSVGMCFTHAEQLQTRLDAVQNAASSWCNRCKTKQKWFGWATGDSDWPSGAFVGRSQDDTVTFFRRYFTRICLSNHKQQSIRTNTTCFHHS